MQTIHKRNAGATIAVLAMIVLTGAASSAQVTKNFALKGETEAGGSVSFLSYAPVSNGHVRDASLLFSLAPYIGYFVMDGFEVGLNPLGFTGNESYGQLMVLVAPAYNFRTDGVTYPFIEALAGYTVQTNGSSRDGFSWGGRGGLKIAVTDKGLLNLSVQYVQITLNLANASERSGSNQLTISAGFTVWFDPPKASVTPK